MGCCLAIEAPVSSCLRSSFAINGFLIYKLLFPSWAIEYHRFAEDDENYYVEPDDLWGFQLVVANVCGIHCSFIELFQLYC